MSNIDIRKFVDINIVHHSITKAASTRDVTVCFTSVASVDDIVSSYEEAHALISSDTTCDEYCKVYFANAGRKLHLLTVSTLLTQLGQLPDEEIVVAYPGHTADLVAAIVDYDAIATHYGPKVKLAVVRATNSISVSLTPHVLVKYSSKEEAQASIAAYLSKINIDYANSVKDYDFTAETVKEESNDDTLLTTCMSNNYNVDMKLAGEVRNIGGNTSDGYDLVNEFMLVVLQQTVQNKVLTVLTDKLKGESGIAVIHTAIAQELNKYVKNGYLVTDKVWTDESLTVVYGDPEVTYTVIEQNTPLLLGYQIKVLPYSALTAADKAAHKAPPIYLVIADSYGIRKVIIEGEVY